MRQVTKAKNSGVHLNRSTDLKFNPQFLAYTQNFQTGKQAGIHLPAYIHVSLCSTEMPSMPWVFWACVDDTKKKVHLHEQWISLCDHIKPSSCCWLNGDDWCREHVNFILFGYLKIFDIQSRSGINSIIIVLYIPAKRMLTVCACVCMCCTQCTRLHQSFIYRIWPPRPKTQSTEMEMKRCKQSKESLSHSTIQCLFIST